MNADTFAAGCLSTIRGAFGDVAALGCAMADSNGATACPDGESGLELSA